jgi:hypothetical protein
LIDSVKALPDVENAAIAGRALMRGTGYVQFAIFPDRPPEGHLNTSLNVVSPEYFDTMGMHFSAGGGLDASTMQRKPAPAVINQEFARRFFPNRDPIGQVFATGRKWVAPEFQITGVVNDTKYRSLREVPPPIYYIGGYGSAGETDTFILHVRARGNPRALISDVQKLAASIDPRISLYETTTLTEEIDRSLLAGTNAGGNGWGVRILRHGAYSDRALRCSGIFRHSSAAGDWVANGAGRDACTGGPLLGKPTGRHGGNWPCVRRSAGVRRQQVGAEPVLRNWPV